MGGGGKGMRVLTEAELEENFNLAHEALQHLAMAVFLERYVIDPRY